MADLDLRPEVSAAFTSEMGADPSSFGAYVVNGFARGYDAARPLLVDLVAFVDDEHEYAVDSCHPQPGIDCAAWCDACKLLGRVPADVLTEARQQLRDRGVDR